MNQLTQWQSLMQGNLAKCIGDFLLDWCWGPKICNKLATNYSANGTHLDDSFWGFSRFFLASSISISSEFLRRKGPNLKVPQSMEKQNSGQNWGTNIPKRQLSGKIKQKFGTHKSSIDFPDPAECLAGLAFKDAAWQNGRWIQQKFLSPFKEWRLAFSNPPFKATNCNVHHQIGLWTSSWWWMPDAKTWFKG